LAAPAIPLFDLVLEPEDLAAVEAAVRGGSLAQGDRVEAFEQAFAELLGVRHAVATSSCTTALHLAYLAAGVGPGDEVIAPAITFAASATAAIYCGATPVFADVVSTHDIGVDVDEVEARITERTKAICAVHYAGYAAAVDRLRELCEPSGIALVEDVAHGPLGDLDGRALGSWGLAGCFSFFSNKVLAVGEGGLISTDDDDVAASARRLRSDPFNYRFDELRAALALSRLGRVGADVERRRALTRRYRELLGGVDGVIVPYRDEDVGHSSCYVMPLVLEDPGLQRQVRTHMRERHGIQTSLLYPAVHEFTAYVELYGRQSRPVAERIARSQVTIPLYPHMTHEQQDRVVEALAEGLAL
jgi:dTDP-4-amino-4,6-dideoxygalactose transaminase